MAAAGQGRSVGRLSKADRSHRRGRRYVVGGTTSIPSTEREREYVSWASREYSETQLLAIIAFRVGDRLNKVEGLLTDMRDSLSGIESWMADVERRLKDMRDSFST